MKQSHRIFFGEEVLNIKGLTTSIIISIPFPNTSVNIDELSELTELVDKIENRHISYRNLLSENSEQLEGGLQFFDTTLSKEERASNDQNQVEQILGLNLTKDVSERRGVFFDKIVLLCDWENVSEFQNWINAIIKNDNTYSFLRKIKLEELYFFLDYAKKVYAEIENKVVYADKQTNRAYLAICFYYLKHFFNTRFPKEPIESKTVLHLMNLLEKRKFETLKNSSVSNILQHGHDEWTVKLGNFYHNRFINEYSSFLPSSFVNDNEVIVEIKNEILKHVKERMG